MEHLNKRWEIAGKGVTSGAAQEAQEYVIALPDRIRKLTERAAGAARGWRRGLRCACRRAAGPAAACARAACPVLTHHPRHPPAAHTTRRHSPTPPRSPQGQGKGGRLALCLGVRPQRDALSGAGAGRQARHRAAGQGRSGPRRAGAPGAPAAGQLDGPSAARGAGRARALGPRAVHACVWSLGGGGASRRPRCIAAEDSQGGVVRERRYSCC
jgi:hypothetical protein